MELTTIRLPSFSPEQVTDFFKKNDPTNPLTLEDIKKYQIGEENKGYYDSDLLKPLFCWMSAISSETLTKNEHG
ncbi:MAG TPA: hypothetical protein VIY08_06135 [Candidatus Nitrosocosmicus sp.]